MVVLLNSNCREGKDGWSKVEDKDIVKERQDQGGVEDFMHAKNILLKELHEKTRGQQLSGISDFGAFSIDFIFRYIIHHQ